MGLDNVRLELTNAVPGPSSVALVVLGLVGVAAYNCRCNASCVGIT